MDDCGTDAEALSSNLAFIYNGISNNGVHSIDIDFDISQGEKGLEISGFDPEVKDDSSDDDQGDHELTRHVREVCGNFSNETIEQFHATSSSNSSRTDNDALQAMSNILRENALRLSGAAQAGPDRTTESAEVSQEDKKTAKTKKNRRKRNVAIQSILDNKSNSAWGTGAGAASISTPLAAGPGTVTCESTPTVYKAPISSGLTNGGGRGRGRIPADKSRKNMSMIRPECIHGYDANKDYDPNDAQRNLPLSPSDFPPL